MSIITKPAGGVLKGVPATFTLSKVELLALPMVAADSYFSDSDNWNKVILKYKSSEGKQYEVVEFNATLASPTGFFSVSEKARDEFEIQTLEIIDFDGGIFIVPRGALTVAEFDIDFNAAPPVIGDPIVWDTTLGGAIPEVDGGISGGSNYLTKSLASKVVGGADYTITYKFTNLPAGDIIHGIINSESEAGFTGLTGITYQQGSVIVYYNYTGSEYGPRQPLSLVNQAGENTIIISKVGTVFTFSLNGTVLINESNHTNQVMVPFVRTWGVQALDSAYVVQAVVASQPVTWNVAGKTGVGTVTTGSNGLITKATGGAGYNVNVLSNEIITGDGYVEFVWSHVNVVMGLAETNHPSGSYTNTIYGGYNAGGGWEIFADPGAYNGSSIQNNALSVGDIVKIERVGNLYKAFKNGLLMHSCNINNTNPLKASICIYSETNGVNGSTISE